MKENQLSLSLLQKRYLSLVACTLMATSHLVAQCTLGNISLNVVAAPEPEILGDPDFCPGGSTTLTLDQPYDTYEWSTGSTNPSITVNAANTYSVTVTNAAGCSGEDEIIVTLLPVPMPTITAAPYQCNGQFVLNAGPGFSSYAWDNGDNTQTTTVIADGTYTVTVTNADGCTGTDDFVVTIPTPPTVNITGNVEYCEGENTVLSATPGFNNYAWTGGGSGANLTVAAPGTYGVTVTDASGCTAETSVVVTENPFTDPTISGGTIICNGEPLAITAEGPNYQSYAWSNNQNTQSISVNIPGSYTVTVTAVNGCTGTASTTLTNGASTFTTITGNTIICNGTSTFLSATGTFASYEWSSGQFGQTISVNQIGVYQVTVTTSEGCTDTATTTVVEGTPPVVTITPLNDPVCEDTAPFLLQAFPAGGVWGGDVSPSGQVDPAALGAGSFAASYTYTDPNGCVGTDLLNFEVLPVTQVSIAPAGPFCASDPITLLNANPPGGTWGGAANAAGEFNPGALGAGFHIVTYSATDPGSCTGTAEITIEVFETPTGAIMGNGIVCQGSGQNINLSFITTGNGPFELTYTLNGTSPTTLNVPLGVTNIFFTTPGLYEISSIVDANGCSGNTFGQSTIVEIAAPQVAGPDIQCIPGQNAYTVTFEITGGDPASYSITSSIPGTLSTSPPYIFISDAIPSGAPYQFIISDVNGCPPVTIEGTFDCACETQAGTMNLTPLQLCDGQTATATFNGGEMLDPNDVLFYVLHSGNSNNLGTIFQINTSPTFDFAPPFVLGQTYYISAVAGDDDGNGSFDQNDPCLSVSIGTPVTWSALPNGNFANDVVICAGETATLFFSLTGNAPFDVTYSDGTQQIVLQNIFNNHNIFVSPTTTTTYTIELVEDSSPAGCSFSPNNIATVVVNNAVTQNINAEICEGESIFLAGAQQTQPGVYTDIFDTSTGCDSTVITTLSVFAVDTTEISETSCDPTQAGVFTEIFTNQNDCDSTVITTVIFAAVDSTFFTDTTCDPTEVGIFSEIFTNQNGCDSVAITTVTLLPADTTQLSTTSCDSSQVGVFEEILTNQLGCDSVVITTITYSETDSIFLTSTTCDSTLAGVFVENLTNQLGCDSVVTTTVELLPSDLVEVMETTCDSTQAGVFTEIFTNQFGCDSTVTTTVVFVETDSVFLTDSTCDPALAGIFEEIFTNQFGCDSIVTTEVALLQSDSTELTSTSCDSAQVGVFTEIFTNQFGCDSTVTTTVTFSAVDSTFFFTTTCDPAMAGVFTENNTNQLGCDSVVTTTVTLLQPDLTELTSTSCDSAQVGVFTEIFTNQFGCDSTVITTVTFSAVDSVFFFATTCDPALAGVFTDTNTNQLGCDSVTTTTVTLLSSDLTEIAGTTCDPAQAGVFTEIFTNQFGCDSTVITTVDLLPSDLTEISGTTCDPAQAGVFTEIFTNQFGCDSTVITTVDLLPSDLTEFSSNTCDPAQAGVFTETLTNQFGCDSVVITTVSLLDPSECEVEFSLSAEPAACGADVGAITIEVPPGQFPLFYFYTGTSGAFDDGIFVNSPFILSSLPPGVYAVTLTNVIGLATTQVIEITETPPPSVSIDLQTAIGCNGEPTGAVSAVVVGDYPPYTFQWSNGATASDLTGLGAGNYALTVTDSLGCASTSSVNLTGASNLEIMFVVNDPDCFNESGGFVEIETTGGIEPYQYAINGGAFQANNYFGGLSAGAYQITVQDANGCESSESFAINAPLAADVELGDDLTIQLGENATLNAIVNLPDSLLANILWTGFEGELECPTCLTQNTVPLVTTTYSISVETAEGCVDSDGMTIFVDRKRQVFVPNAFSPNGDGANDKFYLFAKDNAVVEVHSFLIFSRWGELVFEDANFQPNDPNHGWDGVHWGEQMKPAVFVWFAEIEFIDGTVELFEGDLVLVR